MGRLDLKGKRFGRLIAIEPTEERRSRNVVWRCVCDCGNDSTATASSLSKGVTKSCGCLRSQLASKKHRKYKKKWFTNARSVYKTTYNDGNITIGQFIVMSQLNCFYCGSAMGSSLVSSDAMKSKYLTEEEKADRTFFYNGLDRVNNEKPHNIDNLVPCCKHCNSAKMARTKDEFEAWVEQAYNHIKNRPQKYLQIGPYPKGNEWLQ